MLLAGVREGDEHRLTGWVISAVVERGRVGDGVGVGKEAVDIVSSRP
jgi:hypothetical protein